jgi:TusA-related sulfurtransferase
MARCQNRKRFLIQMGQKEQSTVEQGEHQLDITGEVCPMTFVRTKLYLERLADGEVLRVKLRDGEPLDNVPRAVADHGHEVVRLERLDGDVFELVVRKRATAGRRF